MTRTLTVDIQMNNFADIKTNSIAGMAQIVPMILLSGIIDGQRPIWEEFPMILWLTKGQLLIVARCLTCKGSNSTKKSVSLFSWLHLSN